ncbi:MAG TPA: SPOR domain-containing protein [Xanthobacteraceae bacterium]|nr:SPOR domain-containing protein [Xanthobacteraceae bacterium]
MPPRREPATDPARDAVGDPLAELARLIGQDEAFGAIVRNSARPEPRTDPPPADPPPWRPRVAQPPAWDRDEPQPRAPYAPADEASRYGAARRPLAVQPEAPVSYGHDEPAHAGADDAHGYDAAHAGVEADAGDAHAAPEAAYYGHETGGGYYGEDDAEHQGHYAGEDEYADAVPERRRGGLVIVAAVIGLALVGTAGAFGYWAWSAGPRGEPPLIKADTTANKTVPTTQADGAGNKRIYDRFADKSGATERVVPREEAPADVPTPPRQVYPSAGGVYGPAPTAAPTQAAAPAPAAPPSGVPATGAPHVVRTETIRAGQVAAVDLGQPVAPTLATVPPNPAPAAPAKQPAARAKQGAGQPVALAPPAATQPGEAPAAPATRSAAPSGGYVVQLSSQRTEEDALASFKALATKYAAVFGDRPPLIKRAELGDKGVYYRAQVGPFPTHDQANQFCSNLKIAGGQCIVQKN